MIKRIKMIMLVDDDEYTNLYNKIIITEMKVCEEIKIFNNGKAALDFITSKKEDENYPQPDIIFLDINMPIMDGWEFVENYKGLTIEQQAKKLIVMLTSSINKEDEIKALNTGVVKEFISKPLKKENVLSVIENF